MRKFMASLKDGDAMGSVREEEVWLEDKPNAAEDSASQNAEAVKAEALERQKRDTIAKARFEETKGSIERGEAHIANIELMSVQTPEGQAALE